MDDFLLGLNIFISIMLFVIVIVSLILSIKALLKMNRLQKDFDQLSINSKQLDEILNLLKSDKDKIDSSRSSLTKDKSQETVKPKVAGIAKEAIQKETLVKAKDNIKKSIEKPIKLKLVVASS